MTTRDIEMKTSEADKIIAEYMGFETWGTLLETAWVSRVSEEQYYEKYPKAPTYTKSLDALKGPIEKMMYTHRTLTEHIISKWLVRNAYDMCPKVLAKELAEAIPKLEE